MTVFGELRCLSWLVFPGERGREKPMSNNTTWGFVPDGLQGPYDRQRVPRHCLNRVHELGYRHVIELQLAH